MSENCPDLRVCPDRQLLSVYLDGELPSPWKEKLEGHVSACRRCTSLMEEYRNTSLRLAGLKETGLEAAGERVWQRISGSRQRVLPGSRAIWRRRLSVPVPAAAAAALLTVFLVSSLVFGTGGGTAEMPVLASETDLHMPAQNMESVKEYLSGQESEMVIMHLPENRSFVSNGEPAVLRAADYSKLVSGKSSGGQGRP